MKICFLTASHVAFQETDDVLIQNSLRRRGHNVEWLDWRRTDISWSKFDRIIIRSTWDYHLNPDDFLIAMSLIEKETELVNCFKLLQWNYDKRYLLRLNKQKIPTVATKLITKPNPEILLQTCEEWNTNRLIVKPTISASAFHTYMISMDQITNGIDQFFNDVNEWIIQPFMEEIQTSGEISMMFANGQFTHAVKKKPRTGDFRVQEELGGTNQHILPGPVLLNFASSILSILPALPIYARLDLLETKNGPIVMEVELIEPSLYLNHFVPAADKFAEAFTTKTV